MGLVINLVAQQLEMGTWTHVANRQQKAKGKHESENQNEFNRASILGTVTTPRWKVAIRTYTLLVTFLITCAPAFAQTNWGTITFTNKSGDVISNAVVTKVEANKLTYRLSVGAGGGVARLADLPEGLRARFGFSPDRADNAVAVQRPVPQTEADSKGVLPEEFKNLYFGMSFDEFKEVRKLGMVEISNLIDFRIEYSETMKGDIKAVTYYFDKEGNIPLYELIIEYNDEKTRDMVADKLFGKPNSGDQWKIIKKSGLEIRAWKFITKLVVVAVLPNTEWAVTSMSAAQSNGDVPAEAQLKLRVSGETDEEIQRAANFASDVMAFVNTQTKTETRSNNFKLHLRNLSDGSWTNRIRVYREILFKVNEGLAKTNLGPVIFTTSDGTIISNAFFYKAFADEATYRMSGGGGVIRIDLLPKETQERLGYDPEIAIGSEFLKFQGKRKKAAAAQAAAAQAIQQNVIVTAPDSDDTPTDQIKQFAAERYPRDYDMRLFVIKQQTEAYREIKAMSRGSLPIKVFEEIKADAADRYPQDYDMRLFVIKQQSKAYQKLNQ